jgi:pyruvate dehydrogenase E1 component alpha subunit
VFLELRTFRFRAHSMYDPERYRGKEEVQRWRERDPITLCTQRLRVEGLIEEHDLEELNDAVLIEVAASVAAAEAGHLEPVEDLTRFVYSEVTS